MKSFRRRVIVSSIITAVCFAAAVFVLFKIKNQSVTNENYEGFISFCSENFWVLAFGLVAFLMVVFIYNTWQRLSEYKAENARIRAQKLDDKIIEAISNDYSAYYLVDIDKGEFLDARMDPYVKEYLLKYEITNDNYENAIRKYVDTYVVESDKSRMHKLFSTETIKENISTIGTHSAVFSSSLLGGKLSYIEVRVIPIDDESGRNLVALTFRDVDERVTSQIEKQSLSRRVAENETISSIAQDYDALVFCDFAKEQDHIYIDKLKLLQIDGWNGKTFYEKHCTFAQKYVVEEDRKEYLKQVTNEAIIKGLEKNSSYYVSYRVRKDKEVKYYQTKFIPAHNDFNNGVLVGIYSVDDEKRVELKRNEELKEVIKKNEEMLRVESIYKNAIFAKAVSSFQINLTKDRIVSSVYEVVNGILTDKADYVGGTFAKYNEAIIKAADVFVESQYKESYKIYLSREHLLMQYELGNLSPEYTCMIYSTHRGVHYRKYVNYLSKDEATGDVMSMCVAYDVTNEIKQEEILRTCIGYAYGEKNVDDAVEGIISDIGLYYGASGVLLFELDYSKNKAICTYDWSEINSVNFDREYYSVSLDQVRWILNLLKTYGEINRDVNDTTIPWNNTEEIDIFLNAGIRKFVIVPMLSDNKIVGYMTIVNPTKEIEDYFMIKGLSMLAYSEILRRKEGLVETQITNALSEGYEAVYYIDIATGFYRNFRNSIFYSANVSSKLESNNDFFKDIIHNVDTIIYESDRNLVKEFFDKERILESFKEEPVQYLNYSLWINGEQVYYRIKAIYYKTDEGEGALVVGVSNVDTQTREDIELNEELKKATIRAEEASRAKSDFLSRMSHDIRTPINGVIGMTEIARMNSTNPQKVEECLDKIDGASHHLLEIINEILDMSKIESGGVNVNHAPLNLELLCNECVSIASAQLGNRSLNIRSNLDGIKHSQVLGDELHLKQILINILANAIKFTPDEGTVTFSVTEECEDALSTFKFTIEDTGYGMKPEYLDTIFDRFSQEDEGARSSYKGTGLGMAITKQLVELLDGKINVESTFGVGSKFVVEMPLEIDDSLTTKTQKDEEINLSGLNILLAEDNELNAEIAKVLLEHHGIKVVVVSNGKLALEKFSDSEEGEFNAILMDIMMPEMDGLEATAKIRQLERSDAKTIPIIAMTANAFEEDKQKSFEAGMNDHVSKPVDPKLLQRVIAVHTKRI